MDLPFGLGAYQRGSERLPPVRLINRFSERSPVGPKGVILLQRPGLVERADYSGLCRGIYRQDGVFDGALFEVFGTVLYKDGALLGSVAGTDLVQWVYTIDGLRLLAGGTIYLVSETRIDAEGFSGLVASIAAVNNLLCAVPVDSEAIYYRIPGDTEWNALDFTSAEAEPDQVVGIVASRGELWAFGRSSIEIFYTTDQPDQPLIRADGRRIQRGCASRDSIVALDNTLFWVGEDRVAYRAADVPQRISNHAIEEQLSRSSTLSAWGYSMAGHAFDVVNLDDQCLAYDVATDEWHQLRRYGRDGFVRLGFFDGSTTYVGDEKGWTLDPTAGTDDGQPIERIFTSVAPTNTPISADALEIGLSPGTTPINTTSEIETRWSRDQGRTWTDWIATTLGSEGSFRTRARLRRLGMIDAPGRVFEHRETGVAITRISSVELNPPLGGRSR